jgi:6-methylsalicylate decarboxylase
MVEFTLLAARLARLESQTRFRESVPNGVLTELKRLHCDIALSVDPYVLPCLLRLVSPDRVLFGSDFPHAGAQIIDNSPNSPRSGELIQRLLRPSSDVMPASR